MAEPTRIETRQRELFALFTTIVSGRTTAAKPTEPAVRPEPISADDAELLELGKRRLGPVFGRLIQGDRSNYNGSPSDADFGLIRDLLHLTGHDEDRTDRIMRSLPLARAKWDEPRVNTTWLRYSISRTLEDLKAKGHSSELQPSPDTDPQTWVELELDPSAAGPANGHCSAHCNRHFTVIADKDKIIEVQKKAIAGLQRQLNQLQTIDQANGKRLSHLKEFRQASTFSGKRKDVVESIGLTIEHARQRGESKTLLYYGDREKKKNGEDPGGIASMSGAGPQTVGLTVDLLRQAKDSPWTFRNTTDDRGNSRVEVRFDSTSTLERDLAQLAKLPRAETIRPEPLRCPDCPRAKLRVTKACKSCGQIVAEYDETPPRFKTPVQTLDRDQPPPSSSVDTGTKMSEFSTREPLSQPSTGRVLTLPPPLTSDPLWTHLDYASKERMRKEREQELGQQLRGGGS